MIIIIIMIIIAIMIIGLLSLFLARESQNPTRAEICLFLLNTVSLAPGR
jgi:hypothetical protein